MANSETLHKDGTKTSRSKRVQDKAMALWMQVHRGERPAICGYCGYPPHMHICGDSTPKNQIAEGWRLPYRRSQYSILYSVGMAQELGAAQVVCCSIPTLD